MKIRHFLAAGTAALCALVILPARVHANAISYTATVLAELPGFSTNNVMGINASGQVVGASYFAGDASVVCYK